jgi:outer membrane protein with beta-barrel domain
MTRYRLVPSLLVVSVLIASLSASPVLSAVEPQGKVFEVWVEDYDPAPDVLDSDLAYGVRFAYNLNRRFTLNGEFGHVGLNGEFKSGNSTTELDYSAFLSDFVVDFNFAPSSPVVPTLFAGLGWAYESLDVKTKGPIVTVEAEDLNDDSLTVQAGGALKIQLGKRFELRPAVRFRWFEARSSDDTDTEYLLGFGTRW